MALPPVRLVCPSGLQIDANTLCVLELHIPITLPHQLGPSVLAPPYRPGILGGEDVLNLYAMPVMRCLMAEIVSHLFGSEHSVDALRASEEEPDGHIVILHGFVLSLVCWVRDARKLVEINPRVLRFDLVGEGEGEGRGALGHELGFSVREYTETFWRRYVNDDLVIPMRNGDALATPCQRL